MSLKDNLLKEDPILYRYGSYAIVFFFAIFPLLFNLPFRIHLDLPFEGAYRLYIGQVPYRDFTMPLSYGFFIIPTICFHIFGPFLKSLLYAQAIITIIGGFSFISIFKNLKLPSVYILIAVLVFCLSYTFIYFWPWYNNTSFIYQILGIALILKSFYTSKKPFRYVYLTFSILFTFLTFFTKQDYGGLAFAFGLVLVSYIAIIRRKYYLPFIYLAIYAVIAFLFIAPLLKYDFLYWFNLGQPPHQKRFQLSDIVNEFFLNSEWEKFYFVAIVFVLIYIITKIKEFWENEHKMLLFLICMGIIIEALITKMTSHQSTGNTTYFHGFAIAFILFGLNLNQKLSKPFNLIFLIFFIAVWWSGMYWKYASQVFHFKNKDTAINQEVTKPNQAIQWELSEFKSLEKVKLPKETIEGIRNLKALKIIDSRSNAKVLNLTELTMLAYELNYVPMKNLPLWYHLNVGIFQNQVDTICKNIAQKEYDLVLFEEIPSLDNFFPEEIRVALKKNYKLNDSFLAPRKEGDSFIEVYLP